jgi:Fe-S-cluster containining protein
VKDTEDTPQECPDSSPWYKEGLRFKCTGCGACCTGNPGYVWVTVEEISSIAKLLGISTDECTMKYIRQRDNRYSLVEMKLRNYDCVFLKDSKCLIYQARPKQCRTFPWWKENLHSKESWDIAARSCEGINDQAPLVPYTVIAEALLENQERT